MKILGIDPALNHFGWAVLESKNKDIYYIDSGAFRIAKSEDISDKLFEIFTLITNIMVVQKPNVCAMEESFVSNNYSTSIKLGMARGAAIVAVKQHEIEIASHSARLIKKTIAGSGSADKIQIMQMLRYSINNLPVEVKNDDEADAIAIAASHSILSNFKKSYV